MVFVPMFRGNSPLSLLSLLVVAHLSVGCLGNKKEEVAVEAAAPPPAAYPTTPDGYAGTSPSAPAPPSSSMSPAPAPAAPEVPEFSLREGEILVTYRIELGDNLSKIATKYNSSVSRIKAANGMTNDRIFAGKTLQIPTAAPPGLAMNTPTPPASTPNSYGASADRYGSVSPTSSPSTGSYTSTTQAPSSYQSYPSTTAPAPAASAPASTSYPRVASPPIPPQTQQPAGAFPTPNFGSGTGVQFSE